MPRKKTSAKDQTPKREKKVATAAPTKLKTASKIQDDAASLIPVKSESIPEVQEFLPDQDSLDALIPPGVPIPKKLVPTNAHEEFCVNVWNEAGRLFRKGELLTSEEKKLKANIKDMKNQGEPYNAFEQKLEIVKRNFMQRTGLTEEDYVKGQMELLQKPCAPQDTLEEAEAKVWALRVQAQKVGEAARQKLLAQERCKRGALNLEQMMQNASQDLRALGGSRQIDEDYDDEIPLRKDMERVILEQKAAIFESDVLERIPASVAFGSPIMADHVYHDHEWKRFERKKLLVVQGQGDDLVHAWVMDMGQCSVHKDESFLPKQSLFNSIKDVENAGILATQIKHPAVSMQYTRVMREWLEEWVGKKAAEVFLKFAEGDYGEDDFAANCEDQLSD